MRDRGPSSIDEAHTEAHAPPIANAATASAMSSVGLWHGARCPFKRLDLTNLAGHESLHAFRIMLSMRERRVNRRFTPFAPRESVRRLFSVPESNFRPIDGLRAFSILWVMLMHTVWFQTPF